MMFLFLAFLFPFVAFFGRLDQNFRDTPLQSYLGNFLNDVQTSQQEQQS